MATIDELQNEVIEQFADFDDWMDRYQLLIDLGNDLEPLDEQYKIEQNLIDGCQPRRYPSRYSYLQSRSLSPHRSPASFFFRW